MRIVTSGLQAGERVIVKGLQRVRPGQKVEAEVAEVSQAPLRRAGPKRPCHKPSRVLRRRSANSRGKFFHQPSHLCGGHLGHYHIGGLHCRGYLPVAQYPEITPPTVQVSCFYPGASAQVVAETVAAPIEQQVIA